MNRRKHSNPFNIAGWRRVALGLFAALVMCAQSAIALGHDHSAVIDETGFTSTESSNDTGAPGQPDSPIADIDCLLCHASSGGKAVFNPVQVNGTKPELAKQKTALIPIHRPDEVLKQRGLHQRAPPNLL
jgi:hypothetical protein